MKKVVLSGLLAGIIMLLLNIGISSFMMKFYPTLMSQYDNTSLYRSMKDPITTLFFVYPFLLTMILTFIWDKTKSIFTAKRFLPRGIQFGLGYFVIVIPGLLISYITSPYSLEMVLFWTFLVLIEALAVGACFEKINA